MTLIEGIGDEVTHFFGFVVLLLLGFIAWWSTSISEMPHIQTVLIFERRTQADVGNQRQTLITNQPERNANDPPPNADQDKNASTVPTEVAAEGASVVEDQPPRYEDVAVASEGNSTSVVEDMRRDCGGDVGASADVTEEEGASPPVDDVCEEQASEVVDDPGHDVDNIRIRLKYLNDDQKLVRGKLHELLGDFKRRHFSLELSRERRVRLIFNGQVLQRDEQTLQGCGLYDNCVVHCLVHQQQNVNRPSPQQPASTNSSPPEWNLGGLLYVSLSMILGFAWFLRYHYSQLFTLTTTTALTGLTAMFAVSIIGMYMPDQEAPPA